MKCSSRKLLHFSVSINLSTRWQSSKKEVKFRENECRQYDGTARLIFAESKKNPGKFDVFLGFQLLRLQASYTSP